MSASTEKPLTTLKSRAGRWLCGVGVVLFGAMLAVGIAQSLRMDRRLPSIDVFGSGSSKYIDHLIAQKDYDLAIEELQMQLRMELPDAEVCERLGNLLSQQGRSEEARLQFERVVQLRPDYAEGHYALGSTFLDTDQPELAVPCFMEAATLNPKSGIYFNALGVAMASLGKLIEAEKCFVAAVELSPDLVDAQNNLNRARSELQLEP